MASADAILDRQLRASVRPTDVGKLRSIRPSRSGLRSFDASSVLAKNDAAAGTGQFEADRGCGGLKQSGRDHTTRWMEWPLR